MNDVEPRHGAPRCKCGAPMQPSAYYDGMIRPEGHGLTMVVELTRVRCVSSGVEFQGTVEQAIQAWWSVGAYEQRLVDEREIARLQAEAEVQSREITKLREQLAGQGVLDFGEVNPAERLYACARMDAPYNLMDTMRHLAEATQHLLADHNCDTHGHEQFITAEQSARDMLALWEKS